MNNFPEQTAPPHKWSYNFCRYFVAFCVIVYGWAKIMGSQFTILDSELDKPMGEVTGFWLTWYYFGYSPFYGNFIALVQITAGFLLLYRRTVLLGACILFGVLGNIILIDIFYGIDPGALITACLLEAALCVILGFHSRELFEFFWTRQNSAFPADKKGSTGGAVKVFGVLIIALVPPSITYWAANYNNRVPTELDGKWQVVESSVPVISGERRLTKVYFENNRAFWAVFRYGDDLWKTHHFEIDSQTKTINVWEKWMEKGSPVFSGSYRLEERRLTLEGQLQPSNEPVKIDLVKR